MTPSSRDASVAVSRPLILPAARMHSPGPRVQHAGARPAKGPVDAAPSPRGRALRWTALCALGAWALVESFGLGAALLADGPDAAVDLAVAGVALAAAVVSSIAGFAFSALAGSALAHLHVDPLHAVQTMVVCSTASQLYAVWKIRAAIRWRPIAPMLAGGALTVPLGVWLLHHVDAVVYAVALGGFMMAYGCYAVARRGARVLRGHRALEVAVGALGGITGGLAGFPGAFVTIWCALRGFDKLRQRATYQPYILVMQVLTLACLWSSPGAPALWHAAAFVPFALLGALAGFALFERMTDHQFGKAVGALLVVSGLGLLARAL